MIDYLLQIRILGEASDSIQEVINMTINNTNKGKLYATQDVLTAQIKTLMALNDEQTRKTLA